jgi:hypothetical protein
VLSRSENCWLNSSNYCHMEKISLLVASQQPANQVWKQWPAKVLCCHSWISTVFFGDFRAWTSDVMHCDKSWNRTFCEAYYSKFVGSLPFVGAPPPPPPRFVYVNVTYTSFGRHKGIPENRRVVQLIINLEMDKCECWDSNLGYSNPGKSVPATK